MQNASGRPILPGKSGNNFSRFFGKPRTVPCVDLAGRSRKAFSGGFGAFGLILATAIALMVVGAVVGTVLAG
jgi:hypothetical protein